MRNFEKIISKKQKRQAGEFAGEPRNRRKKTQPRGGKQRYCYDFQEVK